MTPSQALNERKSVDGAEPGGSKHSEKVLTRAGLTRNLGAVHLCDDNGVSKPGEGFRAIVHIASHHVFAEHPARSLFLHDAQELGE